MYLIYLIDFTILCMFFNGVQCYYPIICIPGLADMPLYKMEKDCQLVAQKHPGTEVTTVFLGGAFGGFYPLWHQIEMYRVEIDKYFKKYPDGVHLIGFSLGSLIARAIIETTPNHPVRHFISINGPFMGVYPDGPCRSLNCIITKIFWKVIVPITRKFVLTVGRQKFSSADEALHDPRNEIAFLKTDFLPVINNQIPHGNFLAFKANFLRLKCFIMIGSTKDELVTPYESALAGYYDRNFNIIPMEQQEMYLRDTLGLRTMNENGRLKQFTINGANHIDVIINVDLFDKYVLPHLN